MSSLEALKKDSDRLEEVPRMFRGLEIPVLCRELKKSDCVSS